MEMLCSLDALGNTGADNGGLYGNSLRSWFMISGLYPSTQDVLELYHS